MPHKVPSHQARTVRPRVSRHQEYNRTKRDPETEKFYNSAAWQRLRLVKLAQTPLCEICQPLHFLTAATHVHHIVEVTRDPDLRSDLSNLQSLCKSCHSRLHATRAGPE
jgi:5-methylcytosine-specific restriction enzyme A